MGWGGYGLFDGDGTITEQMSQLERAFGKFTDNYDEPYALYKGKTLIGYTDEGSGVILEKKQIPIFLSKLDKLLKKMDDPSVMTAPAILCSGFSLEYASISWHMLLCLFVNNNIKIPKKYNDILKYGVLGTVYLMRDHADEFDKPAARKAVLKDFLDKTAELHRYKSRDNMIKKYLPEYS